MAQGQEIVPYEEQESRLKRKARESPYMIAGILGLVGVCAHGAYAYKNRGRMSTSIYLMQLRVMAQGAVIFSLTAGVCVEMTKNLYKLYENKTKE